MLSICSNSRSIKGASRRGGGLFRFYGKICREVTINNDIKDMRLFASSLRDLNF